MDLLPGLSYLRRVARQAASAEANINCNSGGDAPLLYPLVLVSRLYLALLCPRTMHSHTQL